MKPEITWLEDPGIFQVNRLPAVSPLHRQDASRTQSLNGIWKVRLQTGNVLPEEFGSGTWHDIPIPGHLQTAGLLPHQYTNTLYPWDGWEALRPPIVSQNNVRADYTTTFIPRHAGRTILTLHGFETAAYVYVNGQFAGYAEDGFTPSRFDITPFLKDGENAQQIALFQRSSASWLEDQDMFRLMGLFRDVELFYAPEVHLEDLTIHTDVQGDTGIVQVKAVVSGDGKFEAELKQDGQSFGTGKEWKIPQARLWSWEKPHLYDLCWKVKKDGKVMDEGVEQIGIRKVEIQENRLLLNGKPLLFRGINRHEFHPDYGRAVPAWILRSDMAWLRTHNFNAVRTSHYPNQTLWYDLADKEGIYIMDESNLETHGSWQKLGVTEPSWNIPGNDERWFPAIQDRFLSMFQRDKNHPSVVMWSLGNESFSGSQMERLYQYAEELDPSRPIHYEGVFWSPDHKEASDVESRMYAKPNEIEAYLQDEPEKPFISCEYAHAMGNSLGNLDEYIALERYPAYAGGFVWDFADQSFQDKYGGDFDDFPNDGNFSGNGILTADRQETAKSAELVQQYSHVKIKVTEKGAEITNAYQETDLDTFTIAAVQKVNGKTVLEQRLEARAAPGETIFVPVAWTECGPGIQTRTVYQMKNGVCLGFGQEVCYERENQKRRPVLPVTGDGNWSISAQAYTAFVNRIKGWQALWVQDEQVFKKAVKPMLIRPFTDNDLGNQRQAEQSIWAAVQQGMLVKETWAKDNQIVLKYALPHVQGESVLSLTFWEDGIDVEMKSDAAFMPMCHGVQFVLKQQAQAEFTARGPHDTYPDRQLAPVETFVQKEKRPVDLRPQEFGLHTDVYALKVGGLTFVPEKRPFLASVLDWESEEIEMADHQEDLRKTDKSVIRILSAMEGVGGDDSWGAPVHDAYKLAKEDLQLQFRMKF